LLFLFAVVAIALITVPLTGGRLSALGQIRLRWVPAIFGALFVQVLLSVFPDGSPALHRALHFGSYALAAAFVYANRRIPGVLVVGLGGLCNLIAITANLGVMPASVHAQRIAGIAEAHGFANSAVVSHPKLLFLGDVFAIPKSWPLHNVFSIGDVILVFGVAVLVHVACGSRLAPRARSRRLALQVAAA